MCFFTIIIITPRRAAENRLPASGWIAIASTQISGYYAQIMTTELDEFTALLYDHKFDVDDIILALCGDTHKGRWLLSTRNGDLIQEAEGEAETKDITDGDDNNHWHVITPLPKSFTADMLKTQAYKRLDDDEKQAVNTLLEKAEDLAGLPPLFNTGFAGGWVRERFKDAALEWLDTKNMVPPSMKHVYHKHAAATKKDAPSKITFK